MFVLVAALAIFFAFGLILTIQHKTQTGSWPTFTKDLNIITLKAPFSLRRRSPGDDEVKLLQDVKPYNFPPLKERSSTKMAMGLRRLDHSNWLTLDSNYLPEHALRANLLNEHRPKVIQCLRGSEEACYEVLEVVSTFLAARFPQHFTVTKSLMGSMISNHLTSEVLPCGRNAQNPLEIAAKLAMEDFNILLKNQETGDYDLLASATLFPAGWRLQERIGTSMANLHAPVPGWQVKLGANVNRYFDHLSDRTAMERTNMFIQASPQLFQDCPEAESIALASPLGSPPITASQIFVRRERQTFTRLPKSNAVCFTVRTFMRQLTDYGDEELTALRSQVLGWEDEIREYKGWPVWGQALMGWCESRLGPAPPALSGDSDSDSGIIEKNHGFGKCMG